MNGSAHNMAVIAEKLDREWLDEGFLNKLRNGEFDVAGYVRFEGVLNTLRQLDDRSSVSIDREVVRLLWFVPQFVEWQVERTIERGADPKVVHGASSNIREMVGSILGEP